MNTSRHTRKNISARMFLFAFILSTVHYPLATVFAGGPGSASVQILKTDISPRAMGMGGSFVAVADDVYAVNYNPAGIGQLYLPEASAMYLSGFEDSRLQYLAFGMPLPVAGFAGLEKPGFAVSAIFSQNGKFTYRPINSDGSRPINADGTVFSPSMDAETNRVLALTYGEKVYSGETNLDGYNAKFEQYLGLSAKYIGSELLGEYSASAFAVDAGWLLREPNLGLAFGAALSNYGTGIKYLKETDPLPSIMRLGLSCRRPTVSGQSILLALENDIYMNESLKSFRAGLEYHFEKYFDFRLGYKALEDNKGATMGLGIRHEGFALDFAVSLANEVFNTSQASFTYRFPSLGSGKFKKDVKYREQVEARPPEKTIKPSVKKPGRPVKNEPPPVKKDSDFFRLY